MQDGSNLSSGAETLQAGCAFCERGDLEHYILQETTHFRIVTDHAPLVEGHLLIIPRNHYTCYGDVPETLDAELFALKDAVRQFFIHYYDAPVFWEHGIYHQTVFHAHLHCFPFGSIQYDLSEGLHEELVNSQDDLRNWYRTRGEYFYLEDHEHATLFPPITERYSRIVREVLTPGVVARTGSSAWRFPHERQEQGKKLIQVTKVKWQEFAQQGVV